MFQPLFKYRRFIWRQALADLRHRYAGTGMGIAWNVIHPLGVIAVYSIVFSSIMKNAATDEMPGKWGYVIFLCSGLFPWMAFSECVSRSCNAFVANAAYLKKLPIPEQVFIAQNAVTTALHLLINFSLLMVISLTLGNEPKLLWLMLPVPLFLLVCLGFSTGLLLGTLNVFFRDISEWVTISLQIAMWTVPIVYVPRIVPGWLTGLLPWHPLWPALSAIRDLFLHGTMPAPTLWIGMIAWPAGMLVIAVLTFGALKDEIRDLV